MLLTPPAFTSDYNEVTWIVNGVAFSQPGGMPLVVADDPDNGLSVELYALEVFGGITPFLIQQFIPFLEDDCDLPAMQGLLTGSYAPVVEVNYTSPQGVQYTSLLACNGPGQPDGAHFTIASTQSYDPNENGEATYSLDFSTELMLFPLGPVPGGTPLSLSLTNSRIAFAVE